MAATTLDARGLPRIDSGPTARRLAAAAYEQLLSLLGQLAPEDWQRPTGYRGWTVRDTVAHLYGAAGAYASVKEFGRQAGQARTHAQEHGMSPAEALLWVQIHEQDDLTDAQLLQRLRMKATKAVEGEQGRRDWFGQLHVPRVEGERSADIEVPVRPLESLSNITLMRDIWIHRIEIAQACDRGIDLVPDVDGAILADVVAEWCEHLAVPVDLDLTGPLPLHVVSRGGGPPLRMDALDFIRVVSGRAPLGRVPDSPLLETLVAF